MGDLIKAHVAGVLAVGCNRDALEKDFNEAWASIPDKISNAAKAGAFSVEIALACQEPAYKRITKLLRDSGYRTDFNGTRSAAGNQKLTIYWEAPTECEQAAKEPVT